MAEPMPRVAPAPQMELSDTRARWRGLGITWYADARAVLDRSIRNGGNYPMTDGLGRPDRDRRRLFVNVTLPRC